MTEQEKIRKALAPLRASDTVVQEVLEMAERKHTHTIKKSTRMLLIAAVAAVLLIGTALAVTYSSWSPGLLDRLDLTEDEAAALEETELVSRPLASDTHDGVTVSIEQAVASGNTALIALRIEGLDIPEGQSLVWDDILLTIDGERAPSGYAGVYEDLHWDGSRFIYSDGSAAPLAEDGFPVPRVVREDGSVELDVGLSGTGQIDTLIGKEITVTIYRLGSAPLSIEHVTPEYTAEGPWVLTWTVEGTETSRTWELDEDLGHGITLTEVVLSPLSVHIEYEYPPLTIVEDQAYDAEGNEFPEEPPFLYKIVMKDGAEYTGVLGSGAMGPDADDVSELEKGCVFKSDMELTRIIDPDEVAALVFCEVGYGDVPEGELVTYTVTLPD